MSHHLFGPSGASRWATCIGSTALIRAVGLEGKDSGSAAALEGTVAHAVGEALLLGKPEPVPGAPFLLHPSQEGDVGHLIDEEMLENARYYRDYVQRLIDDNKRGGCTVLVEEQVSVPLEGGEIFGTADAVIFARTGAFDGGDALHVIDLKYGRGVPVSPVQNLQLILYGFGAWQRFKSYEITEVVLHIVQPRISRTAEPWYTTVEEMREVVGRLSRAHTEALALLDPDVPLERIKAALSPSDGACKFCPAKAQCPAYKQHSLLDFADLTLSPDEVADLTLDQLALDYARIARIEEWISAVKTRALAVANSGQKLPGFKLVAGKAGARKWIDPEKAADVIVSVLGEDKAWERTLLSPAKFEKAAGKGGLGIVKSLTVQSTGSPTLVPADDPRPEITLASTDDFGVI